MLLQRRSNGTIGEMRPMASYVSVGLLCLSISRDLLFHLDGLTSPDQVWEKLSELFGKTDEMRGHQIENELISLSPSSFESLQLYFSKFKALVLQLKQCGIEKKDEQLVLSILSKLGPDYSVFVSTFYATKLTARTWRCPALQILWNLSHRNKTS